MLVPELCCVSGKDDKLVHELLLICENDTQTIVAKRLIDATIEFLSPGRILE